VLILSLTLMYLCITLVSLGLLYYTPQITAWLKTSFGEVPPIVVVLIPLHLWHHRLVGVGSHRRP